MCKITSTQENIRNHIPNQGLVSRIYNNSYNSTIKKLKNGKGSK